MNERCTITIKYNIQTSLSSHNFFAALATKLNDIHCQELVLDFSKITFIASNQFAILGCILDNYITSHPETSLYLSGLNASLMDMIKKNGFGFHFNLPRTPDVHNTVIPYKVFKVPEIKEYESYLTLKIFNRDDLPSMSPGFKSSLQDYLLEIFKNVNDHTTSEKIYTCGQFFPKSSLLFFTIVDNGETIPYNVSKYFESRQQVSPDNPLQWALMEGTSTADKYEPRGIGLYLIQQFIKSNHGQFFIVSGKDAYEINNKGERFRQLELPFPGTIVTLAFNLSDSSFYTVKNQEIVEIQF